LGIFLSIHSEITNLVFLALVCILILIDSRYEVLQIF